MFFQDKISVSGHLRLAYAGFPLPSLETSLFSMGNKIGQENLREKESFFRKLLAYK